MIGPKDRKFLDRRLEIAESDMTPDEKRAALKALKAEMDEWSAWRKRFIPYFAANFLLCCVLAGLAVFSGHVLLIYPAMLPLLIQLGYVMWKATR